MIFRFRHIILSFFSFILITASYYFFVISKPFQILFIDGLLGIVVGSAAALFIWILFMSVFCRFSCLSILANKSQRVSRFIIEIFTVIAMWATPIFLVALFHSLYLASLDRSLSVYFLSYLSSYSSNSSFTKNDVNKILLKGYFSSADPVDRRLAEQIKLGYIEQKGNDSYLLTTRGKKLVKNFQYLVRTFSLNPEFVYPKRLD